MRSLRQTYQKFPQLVKNNVFDVEDNGFGMIRFENGATVLLFKVSWAANLQDDIPLSSKRGRSLLSTLVYGPKGSVKIIDAFEADTVSNFSDSDRVLRGSRPGVPAKADVAVEDVRGDSPARVRVLRTSNEFSFAVSGAKKPRSTAPAKQFN